MAGETPDSPHAECATIDVFMAIYMERRRLADILAPDQARPADDLPSDGEDAAVEDLVFLNLVSEVLQPGQHERRRPICSITG
jgi:hypothetical protein